MIEELKNKVNHLINNSKNNSNELKKFKLIRDILNQDDCFLRMSIEYAYSILRDLQIPENELKSTYTKLISLEKK